MKLEFLDEITARETEKEKKSSKKHINSYYDSEPNQETINAIEDAFKIANGEISVKGYKTFEEMWSDICGT